MFKNFIFDVDSTLVTIEGIDELGNLKNIKKRIANLTNEAMSGKIPFSEVFLKRLELIHPTQKELKRIELLYLENITPKAKLVVSKLQNLGNVFVVTGGYDICCNALTDYLNIPRNHVYTNKILFDNKGNYLGIDESIPLWKNNGKAEITTQIMQKYPGMTVCIGDGISDFEASQSADRFIYFGGVVFRDEVAIQTPYVIRDNNMEEMFKYLY
jgi:phosphoserine phosphatase